MHFMHILQSHLPPHCRRLDEQPLRAPGEVERQLGMLIRAVGEHLGAHAGQARSQPTLQRKQIKAMLREWEKKYPGRVENIFSSLSTVVPSHLMDRTLFEFTTLSATGIADKNGDIAFDEEPCVDPQTVIVKLAL